jgi:hypothetical protein
MRARAHQEAGAGCGHDRTPAAAAVVTRWGVVVERDWLGASMESVDPNECQYDDEI